MYNKFVARIAKLLSLSLEEAAAYCAQVRRASGFGQKLSDQTIYRHLQNKKPPFPEPGMLATVIKQQESFRINTGKRFSAKKSLDADLSSKSSKPNKDNATPRGVQPPEDTPNTPLLDGIELRSPKLIREFRHRVIDENGFLVSKGLNPKSKTNANQERHFHRSTSKPSGKNAEQPTNVFDSIKSLDTSIPGAKIKKLRPKPDQEVLCPICHRNVEYQILFDHVSKRHPEKNAKIVLAQFNRNYETWAKKRSSKK
jgi:hypothetical protein